MEERFGRTFLLVTLGLLGLSFFSYQTNFGTGQVTAAGDSYYDCNDVTYAQSRASHGEYDYTYDLDRDHDVDTDDVDLVKLEAVQHPCPENDCLEVGRTRCNIMGELVMCELNEYGKKVEIATPCEEGRCVTKTRQRMERFDNVHTGPIQLRYGVCEVPFRGTPY